MGARNPHPTAWWGSHSPVGVPEPGGGPAPLQPPVWDVPTSPKPLGTGQSPQGNSPRIYRITATPQFPHPELGPAAPSPSQLTPHRLQPRVPNTPQDGAEASHPKTRARHVAPAARGAARPPPYLQRDPAGGKQAAAGLGELWLRAAPASPFF